MSPSPSFPIELAVTPRFDVFYALYTLASPGQTSLAAWKQRAALRVPRDFDRVAKRVAPVPIFWPLLADALQGVAGELTFDELVTSLRSIEPRELQSNILSGIFHDERVVESLLNQRRTLREVLEDPDIDGAELLVHFGLRARGSNANAEEVLARLLSEPESFREELVLVLQRFWQTGFRRDWAALEPVLKAESFRMQELREQRSLADFVRELKFPVTIDAKQSRVESKSASIDFSRIERCYVIPSAFNLGRWWAKYEGRSRRVRLYFPINTRGASPNTVVEDDWTSRPNTGRSEESHEASAATHIDAELVFRALGDTTRYAIATILAKTPMTSADLARRLNVSKPTITHHIQSLRNAGLIVGDSARGGATRLSLNAATLRRVSEVAIEQLYSAGPERHLTTTRKRRK